MSIMSYTARQGDTLFKIARNNNTTVAAILRANPEITDPDKIKAGQKIIMPATGGDPYNPDEGHSYTVKEGDHLLKIVRAQYGDHWPPSSLNELVDLIVRHNKLPNRDRIEPGQVLWLPRVE